MVTVKDLPYCDYQIFIMGPNGTTEETCGVLATHRIYWPGRGERDLCSFHAEMLTRITRGMGIGEKIVELNVPVSK